MVCKYSFILFKILNKSLTQPTTLWIISDYLVSGSLSGSGTFTLCHWPLHSDCVSFLDHSLFLDLGLWMLDLDN